MATTIFDESVYQPVVPIFAANTRVGKAIRRARGPPAQSPLRQPRSSHDCPAVETGDRAHDSVMDRTTTRSRSANISSIRMFDHVLDRSAFVQFDDLDSAQRVHAYHLSAVRPGIRWGQQVRASWAVDSTWRPGGNWAAVVLRNLPPRCDREVLRKNCTKQGERVRSVADPRVIKGMGQVWHMGRTGMQRGGGR